MLRGPKEKKERALGERLYLKGERCDSPKCALVRRPFPPGAHGKTSRRASSDFGKQLKEKQKFKFSYGLNERNLRRLFLEADQAKEGTSAKLLEFMERRLDNVVYRLRFAPSRSAARKYVTDGHIEVNHVRVRSPGMRVGVGDTVRIREHAQGKRAFAELTEKLKEHDPPSWLVCDVSLREGKMIAPPVVDGIQFETALVVESFSK